MKPATTLAALATASFLAGCAAGDPGPATPFEPIRPALCAPGDAPQPAGAWWTCDALSRATAEQITAHNEIGEREYGWKAR